MGDHGIGSPGDSEYVRMEDSKKRPSLDQSYSIRDLGYEAEGYKEKRFNLLRPGVSSFGTMIKLIFRWRSSIWHAVFKELLVFLAVFFTISLSYRFLMTESQRTQFENFSLTFTYYVQAGTIPVAFVLGFFVQTVYTRWWGMWMTLAWIDPLAIALNSAMRVPRPGQPTTSEESKMGGPSGSTRTPRAMKNELHLIRKTILRYCNLTFALAGRAASAKMRALYPSLRGLVADGLLTREEELSLRHTSMTYLPHTSDWWQAIPWAMSLVQKAHDKGYISTPVMSYMIQQEILKFRAACAHMFDYDLVGVPLIYTQLAASSTYMYFMAVLVGRAQFLDPSKGYEGNRIDFYFPIFSIMEFVILVGWLKVALKMLDPYGFVQDDVSFDLHWVLHRNVEVGNVMISKPGFTPRMQSTVPLTGPGSTSGSRAHIVDKSGVHGFRGSGIKARMPELVEEESRTHRDISLRNRRQSRRARRDGQAGEGGSRRARRTGGGGVRFAAVDVPIDYNSECDTLGEDAEDDTGTPDSTTSREPLEQPNPGTSRPNRLQTGMRRAARAKARAGFSLRHPRQQSRPGEVVSASGSINSGAAGPQ